MPDSTAESGGLCEVAGTAGLALDAMATSHKAD
jgi:hypothetical protein